LEYELTDFGQTMLPVLEAIALWGRKTGQELGKVMSKEEAKAFFEKKHDVG
jgi:DNA-binding HxlR family transcriptional regulator